MSERTKRALICLSKSVNENSAHIREVLRKAGVNPDPALVYSAAKFYEALSKLAEE